MWWHGKIRGGWKIIENILQQLVENSQNAIDDGIYDITETLPKSEIDLQESIKNNSHASLITEIKFSSPAEGDIRQISDPIQIAKSMISGGAQALSILTQPYLFNGSPEYFIKNQKKRENSIINERHHDWQNTDRCSNKNGCRLFFAYSGIIW